MSLGTSPKYNAIASCIGNTPLVSLNNIVRGQNNIILAKLESRNPGGSVKDRAALSMIQQAEARGDIRPGDTLIEATSGNTGIALAMVAACHGYRMHLIMPDNLSVERRQNMAMYGAQLTLTPASGGMEAARDLAQSLTKQQGAYQLNQFHNQDNPKVHYETTGPEIWRDTAGKVTCFISAMGTTGTITGVSRFLKQQSERVLTIGVQPQEGAQIPGIRKWPAAYLPTIYDPTHIDQILEVSQKEAEDMARTLPRQEGISCGPSSGGAVHIAQKLSQNLTNAVIVVIICDSAERYFSLKLW